MKKNYTKITLLTLLSFMFGISSLIAQTTLTAATTNPIVGESFDIHSYDASAVSVGSAGANVTWDFSTVTSTGVNTISWISSSSTPYSASYSNANLSFTGAGYYYYYATSSTDYSSCGGTNPSGQVISYSDLEKQLVYPMTFNTTYVDAFAATYDAGGMYLDRAGTMTGVADGYGTLILPYGTITDVLRVKLVEDYDDSYAGSPMMTYDTEAYLWYKAGVHQAVFSHTTFIVNGGAPTIYGMYIDASEVGIDNVEGSFGLHIYPNPNSGSFYVELTPNHKKTILEVIDIYGKIVYQTEYTNIATVKEKIDLSTLSKGVYIVQVTTEDSRETKRISIQ